MKPAEYAAGTTHVVADGLVRRLLQCVQDRDALR